MSVRLRRLQSEHERLKRVFDGHEQIRIVEARGLPPDRYTVEYRLKGLVEENGQIAERSLHRAEIRLGDAYPRELPYCVMLTPVFHPNIDHLAICTEDIASAGRTLDRTIIFIGEMICYQAFNLKSPRNGDAARWASENRDRLPLDGVDLFPPILLHHALDELTACETETDKLVRETSSHKSAVGESVPTGQVCRNCGRGGEEVALTACANQHWTCVECRVPCGNCRAATCLLCEISKCFKCGEISCPDCTLFCPSCGKSACLRHVRHCGSCPELLCQDCEHCSSCSRSTALRRSAG